MDVIVTADNLATLGQTVALAAERRVKQCTFVGSAVPLAQSIPAIRAALARCRELGIEGRVKHLPRCLLESDAAALIDDRHEATARNSSCLFEALCGQSEACPGLAHEYVARFGWEERRLQPTPRTHPWREPAPGPHAHPEWLALLGSNAAHVERVELDRVVFRYFMRLPSGGRLVIELRSRDEQKPAFTRSRSFDITYTRVEGQVDQRAIARFMDPIAAAIVARDDGSLSIDPRGDLPPLPSLG
jgi:hypothetical protein